MASTSTQRSTRDSIVSAQRRQEPAPFLAARAERQAIKTSGAKTYWLAVVVKGLAAIIMLASVSVFALSLLDANLSAILGGFVFVLGIGLGIVLLCGGVLVADVKAIKTYLGIK